MEYRCQKTDDIAIINVTRDKIEIGSGPKQMSCQILSPDPDMHCIADGSASFLEELFWRWNVFKHFHGNYIG